MNEIISSILNITNEELDKISFASYGDTISVNTEYAKYFLEKSGKEHYRLLAYISTLYNNSKILDIGTNRGYSAIGLSYNKTNQILSYDIEQFNTIPSLKNKSILSNVTFKLGNCLELENLHEYPLILLDTFHDGVFEELVLNKLMEINWKGILIMDDINDFPALVAMWKSITLEKYDLTNKGHCSGTGLIVYG